jgi:hypothetical protein
MFDGVVAIQPEPEPCSVQRTSYHKLRLRIAPLDPSHVPASRQRNSGLRQRQSPRTARAAPRLS